CWWLLIAFVRQDGALQADFDAHNETPYVKELVHQASRSGGWPRQGHADGSSCKTAVKGSFPSGLARETRRATQFEVFMSVLGHGNQKYPGSQCLSELVERPGLSIEHRRIEAGLQSDFLLGCTEVVMMVSGRSTVRRTGNGDNQQTLAQPGT